jgi:hypothetical protein
MKKREIMAALAPFTNDLEITVTNSEGMEINIKHLDYSIENDGEGIVTIVPMGAHLSKDKRWVRVTK